MGTLFIGKNSLFLHEVESTNTYAMNLLRNVNPIEGTIVFTDNQTKGKGQRGALWSTKTGQNITVSVILKPQFLGLQETFYLSKISALAVYDVLTDILPSGQYDIKIKWPNDILVNKQKIAGILIENNFLTNAIQYSVIGIGLNVNQSEFADFERMATSLKLLTQTDHDRTLIMERLCSKLEKWYLKLKEQKREVIDTAYLDCLFGIHQTLNFSDANHHTFEAKIIQVTKSGLLALELPDNEVREYDIKEIRFLI
ncbi:MAG: biotin--[acetyl-CoA-carboxylase] ligase [Bacteroidetes bacterium]|nr:biotin--[acetyl-CoA-carboxylase] ligase [Bacteroidota bacterium]